MTSDRPRPPSTELATPLNCIGVFDSGVGGLSVLRALRQRLPAAWLVYVGDVAHAPYGERPAAAVLQRCMRITAYLAARGARMVVVACNTATVLCIQHLREVWPALTFVGVEPGVKPAAAGSRTGRIAVMATPATCASPRLRQLIDLHASTLHVHVQACPGLADLIERGVLGGESLLAVLRPCCDAVRAADVDTVVLGCTHYPFVAGPIRSLLGERIALLDTAVAVTERVASLWPHAPGEPPTVHVLSTGSPAAMRGLLSQCPGLASVEVESLTL